MVIAGMLASGPKRNPMKFDLYIFNSYVPELDGDGPELYAKWLEQAELAEELGFHCVWLTEHHFGRFGGMMPNPQIIMAALAQRTKRIRLGTAVTLLPLHNPLRIAEDIAMLDIMSNGRIDVGVGRGMDWINFGAFGADKETAQERLVESIGVLQDAWTKEACSWHGRFFDVAGPITVLPRPVQQPHPPIWMTANRDAAHFRWIAEHGLDLMTIPWTLPSLNMSRQLIGEYREALHRSGHTGKVLGLFPVYVAESLDRARKEVEPHWVHMRQVAAESRGGQGTPEGTYEQTAAQDRAFFGDPEMCREMLAKIRDLGLDQLALQFHFGGLPQDRVLESMRLFMAEVAPAAS
jgi:alkanesulfonate monooxygenase SsuD/methylene tetrahydromethanopterin reductase-like flavin-dependent oxidoreductase (luciferase family)